MSIALLRRLSRVLLSLLLVSYPFVVYFGRDAIGARWLGAAALALVSLHGLATWLRPEPSEGSAAWLRFAPLAVIWLAASLSGEERVLMLVPALVCIVMGFGLARSLTHAQESWIERFARASRKLETLPPTASRYCRKITVLWSVFLLLTGLTNAALALWAPIAWWTLFSGGISYALTGLLLAGEYTYRTLRVTPIADREARDLDLSPIESSR